MINLDTISREDYDAQVAKNFREKLLKGHGLLEVSHMAGGATMSSGNNSGKDAWAMRHLATTRAMIALDLLDQEAKTSALSAIEKGLGLKQLEGEDREREMLRREELKRLLQNTRSGRAKGTRSGSKMQFAILIGSLLGYTGIRELLSRFVFPSVSWEGSSTWQAIFFASLTSWGWRWVQNSKRRKDVEALGEEGYLKHLSEELHGSASTLRSVVSTPNMDRENNFDVMDDEKSEQIRRTVMIGVVVLLVGLGLWLYLR